MTDFAAMIAALPQERPFLFVDGVESVERGARVVGWVEFAPDHPVFDGHLPGRPLVPGVILIEALAQISGLVLMQPGAGSTMGYLAEVRRMRFRRVVQPGERVTMRSVLVRQFGTAAQFEVEAEVAGEPVAAGEIVVGGMA